MSSLRLGETELHKMFRQPSKADPALGYFVNVQDWPVGLDDETMSSDDILATLGDMSEVYDAAMNSLAPPPTIASRRPNGDLNT